RLLGGGEPPPPPGRSGILGRAMTILRIINRGVDWETYHAINAEVDIEHWHPLGLIMHGASEVGGTVQIAQVWDSEEYAERFDEETLKPALRRSEEHTSELQSLAYLVCR